MSDDITDFVQSAITGGARGSPVCKTGAAIGNPILIGKRIKRNPDFIYRGGI